MVKKLVLVLLSQLNNHCFIQEKPVQPKTIVKLFKSGTKTNLNLKTFKIALKVNVKELLLTENVVLTKIEVQASRRAVINSLRLILLPPKNLKDVADILIDE